MPDEVFSWFHRYSGLHVGGRSRQDLSYPDSEGIGPQKSRPQFPKELSLPKAIHSKIKNKNKNKNNTDTISLYTKFQKISQDHSIRPFIMAASRALFRDPLIPETNIHYSPTKLFNMHRRSRA
jgi:hypothetical protein